LELVITLIKSFGLMMGISGGTLLVFGLAMIVWVRKNAKSKVFAFFVEPNRELTTELITIDPQGNPDKVRSEDGGDYLIHPTKMFWHSWPPGFPSWVKEPIPACLYVRNQAEPLDPVNTKSILTAHSLRYMTDEEMLRQTWKDAREQLDADKPFNQSKISLYLSVAIVIALCAVAYMSYNSMTIMQEIQLVLQGAAS
jgi:hypothetical protein